MLRMVAHQSAAAARQYYAQGLSREDYYSEGQEIIGKWHGLAAERLGLYGEVTPEAFADLVENRHPVSGERLTPRNKVDRRVGYDINFHAPKSLSLLHAMTGDKDLMEAFRTSVAETMGDLETLAAVRVRKGGANGQRVTGNLVWGEFVHLTARPVGGLPDPHLHCHLFTMNLSFDEKEDRWKAGQFHDMKQRAPFYEAVFHSKLAGKIAGLGYKVERTPFGWELGGIPRPLIETFSRRTAQIDRMAAEKGIHDPKAKDALGAATREGKNHGMTGKELRESWLARMTDADKAAIDNVYRRKGQAPEPAKITASIALDHAIEKLFEKNSVVETDRVQAEALRYGVGQLSPDQVSRAFATKEIITQKIDGLEFCTTLDVLAEEVSLISFVRSGRGKFAPIAPGKPAIQNEILSGEQKAAVRHIISSRDQVMAIRGGAGVGKTTLMKEAAEQIEKQGFRLYAFAPSASASRETLRNEGFAGANTVAHFLANKQLQRETRGQVIWIDEAGLLGVRDLWRIVQIAGPDTRVILTGDTAQHAPVARGDAFRLLQRFAGMRVAEVKQIRRQEKEDYRQAVDAMSKADLKTAFRRLDAIGAIVEIGNEEERYGQLAADYLELSRKGSPPMVVSPTHAESGKVTAAIRGAKQAAGQLGPERIFRQLHALQWEEVDRKRPENFREGLVVQLHQNAPGFKRGEQLRVLGVNEAGEVKAVSSDGVEKSLPLKHPDRFLVFEEREIAVAKGDKIRITRNGETADGRRINNGSEFTVEKFDRRGNIVLTTGGVLDADHGHLAYGYCQTSHSSQSKSVRDVLIAQSAESFVAASREQFYVSLSRGKESVRIYTDSRSGLEKAVGFSSARKAGVELAGFNREDLAGFMSTEMNGKQWRDAVASRRAADGSKTFVENLIRGRRESALNKDAGNSWEKYVATRRATKTIDGRHKSRGAPAGTAKRIGDKHRDFNRPTAVPKEPVEKKAEQKAAEKKAEPQNDNRPEKTKSKPAQKIPTRKERLVKAYKASAENLKKVLNRQSVRFEKEKEKPQKKPERGGDLNRAAAHSMKQKKVDVDMAAQKAAATKQKTPVQRVTKGR